MDDYDDIIAKQPRGRLTRSDAQKARYGSRLDEQRYVFRQTLTRYAKYITTAGAVAGAVAALLKALQGG